MLKLTNLMITEVVLVVVLVCVHSVVAGPMDYHLHVY